MKEIAAQTRTAACDSTIGEKKVDSAKRRRYVDREEAVEEADWGVSGVVSG